MIEHTQQPGKRRIYTVLVGDLFHYGHVEFLKQARAYGDYLVAGVVRDAVANSYKRTPVLSTEERLKVIAACRYVDEAWEMKEALSTEFMQKHNFDLYVYAVSSEADEQRIRDGHRDRLEAKYFQRIPYTDGISTTAIIQRVAERFQ